MSECPGARPPKILNWAGVSCSKTSTRAAADRFGAGQLQSGTWEKATASGTTFGNPAKLSLLPPTKTTTSGRSFASVPKE